MKIVWFDINRIIPLDYNPRFIKDDSFRKLQQSILFDPKFREIRPLLLNKKGDQYFVYAGTQRWRACKDLGWPTIPVSIEEDLPEELIKERMLKDNIHSGVWDVEKLQEFDNTVLEVLDITDFNKAKLHFDSSNKDEVKPGHENLTIINAGERTEPIAAFPFNLIFANVEAKDNFESLVKSLETTYKKPVGAIIIDEAKKIVGG